MGNSKDGKIEINAEGESFKRNRNSAVSTLSLVDDSKLARMADAYMQGKTLHQLARSFRLPLTLVTEIAKKEDWEVMRQSELALLRESSEYRLKQAKLTSIATLLDAELAMRLSMNSKIDRALREGHYDAGIAHSELNCYLKIAQAIASIDVDQLLKPIESAITKTPSTDAGVASPAENRLSHAEMLAKYANAARERDRLSRRSG